MPARLIQAWQEIEEELYRIQADPEMQQKDPKEGKKGKQGETGGRRH